MFSAKRIAASLDTATLRHHVQVLSNQRDPLTHPEQLETAFQYVHDLFAEFGLDVEIDPFQVGQERFRNVLGISRSRSRPNTWVVLAAHVDAVPETPGADDNATGVASLIECARLVSGLETACTICWAATDLEEYGIRGSRHLARRLHREGVDVRAMLSLEMVGYTSAEPDAQNYPPLLRRFYPSTADFIALVGNRRSRTLLKKAERCFRGVRGLPVETLTVPFNGWVVPATRLSDHAPFWDLGYRALMVTDTAFFRNPHYHQPTDTVETLDFGFLNRVTQAVASTMVALAAEE